MDMNVFIGLTALPLLVHLAFVNMNLGISIISVYFRHVLNRIEEAKILAKILIAGEFVSGTLGTVLTVVLAGIWTPLMNIAANVLYIPLLISIIGISLRLPGIGGYWYTIESGKRLNLFFGFIMVLGGLMIPFGFRYIFSFINYPLGLLSLSPLEGDIFQALYNPLFPVLYIKTVIGVFLVGFSTTVAILKFMDGDVTALRDKLYTYIGITAIAYIVSNISYLYVLGLYSPFITLNILSFNNITSSTLVLFVISSMLLMLKGFFRERIWFGGRTSFILSISAILLAEFTYDYSRFPYFVVIGEQGIDAIYFLNRSVAVGLVDLAMVMFAIMAVVTVSIIGIYYLIVRNYFD